MVHASRRTASAVSSKVPAIRAVLWAILYLAIGTILNLAIRTALVLAIVVVLHLTIVWTTIIVTNSVAAIIMMATSYACRTVVWRRTEISAIPAIMHSYVLSVARTIVALVMIVVTMSAMCVPSMPSAISGIEVRTSEIEVVAVRIAQIDAKVPITGLPVKWTIEIAGSNVGIPLPVKQYIAQVQIPTLPVCAKHI